MNAIDTNVFVYAFDEADPYKRTKAVALLDVLIKDRSKTLLFSQVAGELLAQLRRWEAKGKISTEEVESNFNDVLRMFPFRRSSKRLFSLSFKLRSRYSLSHWDSMLVAAAIDAGVNVFYSEDMAPGTSYDGVTVVNPFS